MEPNKKDSIITKYASLIAENKEKRKLRGEWNNNEPDELIFDCECGDGSFVFDNGDKGFYPWQYTNLISEFCVRDIFGDDSHSVCRLLEVNPALEIVQKDTKGFGKCFYYREQDILKVIDILTTLAKSNFVTTLRPVAQYIKEADEPVYLGTDVMNILGIKKDKLQQFRQKGYLGFTKYEGSDKIWYTKKDLEKFLNNPKARHEPWK